MKLQIWPLHLYCVHSAANLHGWIHPQSSCCCGNGVLSHRSDRQRPTIRDSCRIAAGNSTALGVRAPKIALSQLSDFAGMPSPEQRTVHNDIVTACGKEFGNALGRRSSSLTCNWKQLGCEVNFPILNVRSFLTSGPFKNGINLGLEVSYGNRKI